MYLSGYVTTPACLLSSHRVEKTRRRHGMKKNIFKRKRVVLTTIGSLGDLHPYIALALEMRKRYIEPIIATSNTYRERVESLNIEFRQIRPETLEPDTTEYRRMLDGV